MVVSALWRQIKTGPHVIYCAFSVNVFTMWRTGCVDASWRKDKEKTQSYDKELKLFKSHSQRWYSIKWISFSVRSDFSTLPGAEDVNDKHISFFKNTFVIFWDSWALWYLHKLRLKHKLIISVVWIYSSKVSVGKVRKKNISFIWFNSFSFAT